MIFKKKKIEWEEENSVCARRKNYEKMKKDETFLNCLQASIADNY
jgi:hypothetical protein